jgi:hypothetical protein
VTCGYIKGSEKHGIKRDNMRAYELNELTSNFEIKSGHYMCHPETCQCWEFRVYDLEGNNVLNSDSSKEVIDFCKIETKGK